MYCLPGFDRIGVGRQGCVEGMGVPHPLLLSPADLINFGLSTTNWITYLPSSGPTPFRLHDVYKTSCAGIPVDACNASRGGPCPTCHKVASYLDLVIIPSSIMLEVL
mmetsp:Transcript_13363/g.32432  ORF Transcript_13363/g.32432 Transcript_13363/m.32432 type:complete len:107 (-) Transcript_13363:62-382(-)